MARLLALGAAGEALLAAFVDQLTELGVDVPDRRYVAPGQLVAWDGDQLIVNYVGVSQGEPGAPIGASMTPYAIGFHVTFAVGLLRKVPGVDSMSTNLTMAVPTAAEIDAAGQQAITDGGALAAAAGAIFSAAWTGQLPALLESGEPMVMGAVQSVGPEGGLAGSRVTFDVPAY